MLKRGFIPEHLVSDLMAGVVVFLVALPLCLGVPLAARAPLFSGIVAGIVGGIVVGGLSGSRTSVSGGGLNNAKPLSTLLSYQRQPRLMLIGNSLMALSTIGTRSKAIPHFHVQLLM
jgi:MFS superfamily sulfate permease-like transporter